MSTIWALTGPASSIGVPSTSMMRPSVPAPTGGNGSAPAARIGVVQPENAPNTAMWRRFAELARERTGGAVDIHLEVLLQSAAMRERGQDPVRLSHSNYKDAYWTVAQMLAHHTVNGCNLLPGDLLGTGTLSGPRPEQGGSLLELSQGGKQPLTLANGEQRRFLEDGDSVILRGWCAREGFRRIGFGECRAMVRPART